ncbi:MAG: TetR family transcriptional regulator [Nitriliruptorales bacterium]|nr:TetR family transcriptional regulator [Nitriliruptorales bacterium]
MTDEITTPEARREQTRRSLLASAEQQFLEFGYHNVTLDGVAEGAGLTKGAIYSNFTSKVDLFFAVLEQRSRESMERYQRAALAEDSLEGVIGAVTSPTGPSKPEWEWSNLDVEARALAARDPEVSQRLAELQRRQIDRVTDLLEEVSDRLDVELARPPEQVAVLAVAATTGLADLARAHPDADYEPEFHVLVELLARLALEA